MPSFVTHDRRHQPRNRDAQPRRGGRAGCRPVDALRDDEAARGCRRRPAARTDTRVPARRRGGAGGRRDAARRRLRRGAGNGRPEGDGRREPRSGAGDVLLDSSRTGGRRRRRRAGAAGGHALRRARNRGGGHRPRRGHGVGGGARAPGPSRTPIAIPKRLCDALLALAPTTTLKDALAASARRWSCSTWPMPACCAMSTCPAT